MRMFLKNQQQIQPNLIQYYFKITVIMHSLNLYSIHWNKNMIRQTSNMNGISLLLFFRCNEMFKQANKKMKLEPAGVTKKSTNRMPAVSGIHGQHAHCCTCWINVMLSPLSIIRPGKQNTKYIKTLKIKQKSF